MSSLYSCTILVGGNVTADGWHHFLKTLRQVIGNQPLELVDDGAAMCMESIRYSEIQDILNAAREHGVSITIDADGCEEIGPSLYVWFPDMEAWEEADSAGVGNPQVPLAELRRLASDNVTINMVIAKLEVFERPVPALLIDGQEPDENDLGD